MFVPRIARRLASAAQEATVLTLMCVADCSMLFAQAVRGSEASAVAQTPPVANVVSEVQDTKVTEANEAAPQGESFFSFKVSDSETHRNISIKTIKVFIFTNDPDRSFVEFTCPGCSITGCVRLCLLPAEALESLKDAGATVVVNSLPVADLAPLGADELTWDTALDVGTASTAEILREISPSREGSESA